MTIFGKGGKVKIERKKEWQYASLAIVPKKTGTQVKSIRVICAYERNGNVAYFDNLSLTQEVAQTMKYDKEGKLVSVKSTGKEEETSKYENGNLKELVTGGNGTYTYDYDKDHNLKSVTNDFVKDTLTHDSMGNTLTSTMESAKTSAGKIVSTLIPTVGTCCPASPSGGIPPAMGTADPLTKWQA